MFEPHINYEFIFSLVRIEGSVLHFSFSLQRLNRKNLPPVTPVHKHLYSSYHVDILYKLPHSP